MTSKSITSPTLMHIDKVAQAMVDYAPSIRSFKDDFGYWYFDYPEYGGLPKRISNRLQSHEVDAIQEHGDKKHSKEDWIKILTGNY